jgi:sporulation protein YlmC with PRC-barrel domain
MIRTLLAATALAAVMGAAQAQSPAQNPAQAPVGSSSPSAVTTPTPPAAMSGAPAAGATTGSIGSATNAANAGGQMTVDRLEDMDLVTANGAELGEIEGVFESNNDKKQFVVIQRGGFLGFGGKQVAIPLESLAVQNDKLVVKNMDEAQIDAMPAFQNENGSFRELDEGQNVTVAQQ